MRIVRFATIEDIPAILHLLEQVNLIHHLGRPDLFRRATKYGEIELCAILQDPKTPVFVCEENGAVLGHAFCILQEIAGDRLLCDRKTLYLDDICVDEAARGKGVGHALYRHVEAYAKALGCYNMTLNVWCCNPGAMRFYEAMGLVPQKVGLERIL